MTLVRKLVLACLRSARREGLSSRVYRLLVAEIFKSLAGYLMLSVGGLIFAVYASAKYPGLFWKLLLAAMSAVSCARLVLFWSYRKAERNRDLSRAASTAVYELAFAILAIGMSALIGVSIVAFSASNQTPDIICALILAMGIVGGISGRNGSRPKIAIAQIAVVIAPLIVSLATGFPAFRSVACSLLVIFVLATYLSIKAFYASLRGSYENERRVHCMAMRLKQSSDLLQIALDNMTTGLLFFDEHRKVVIANKKVREILGDGVIQKIIGRQTIEFYPEFLEDLGLTVEDGARLRADFFAILQGRSEGHLTMLDRRRSRTFELRLMPVPDRGAVMSVEDVTEKRLKEREIHRLAHFDNLTGLANRFTFEEELNARIKAATSRDFVVCYLDLDRFKTINDEFGHHEGDRLLRVIAERIVAALRTGDFAARLSGDEFALILDAVDGSGEAETIVAEILSSIAQNVRLRSSLVKVGASAGMVRGSDDVGDAEATLGAADLAMYEAKKTGGGTALWYDREMDVRSRHLRTLMAHLELALDTDQLSLVYQPILDFRSGTMVACEALARWQHPEFGPISPAQFIPLAEQGGLIDRLGRWAMIKACRDIKAWGRDAVKVAVNVSPLQFKNGSICDVVLEAERLSGIERGMLELELTESAIASDPVSMKQTLERLADMGVGIALDDFGTGYSSLSLLHDLPISKIKLDRTFVAALDTNPALGKLMASIVQMAQAMKKQLVIEGIETPAQLLAVSEAQARFVQGYYFCRPLTLDEIKVFSPRSVEPVPSLVSRRHSGNA